MRIREKQLIDPINWLFMARLASDFSQFQSHFQLVEIESRLSCFFLPSLWCCGCCSRLIHPLLIDAAVEKLIKRREVSALF